MASGKKVSGRRGRSASLNISNDFASPITRLHGTEFVIALSGTNGADTVLPIDISPIGFARLGPIAKYWALWRPIKFRFRMVTVASTTSTGRVCMGVVEKNTGQDTAPTTFNQICQLTPSAENTLYKNLSVTYNGNGVSPWYNYDSTSLVANTEPAILWTCISPITGYTVPGVIAHLYVDYVIDVKSPTDTTINA